jgi:hypothetical protein
MLRPLDPHLRTNAANLAQLTLSATSRQTQRKF